MKVKCIRNYHDIELDEDMNIGDELEVTEARAKVLINAKVAEKVLSPTPTKVATKKAPAKKKEG